MKDIYKEQRLITFHRIATLLCIPENDVAFGKEIAPNVNINVTNIRQGVKNIKMVLVHSNGDGTYRRVAYENIPYNASDKVIQNRYKKLVKIAQVWIF